MNKVEVKYSRSSGPGGQHVNKVDTKVDLRFHVESSTWIPDAVRDRMLIQVSAYFSDNNGNIYSILLVFILKLFSTKIKSTRMDTLW